MAPAGGLTRKEFLALLAGATAGLAAVGPARAGDALPPSSLPLRRLGAAGDEVPILGLGGWHLGDVADEPTARTLVETALDEGIRFFDTAEHYQRGGSERWLGAALADVRRDVFMMTKTYDRTRSYESAKRHLGESLERLRTDHLDLFQLHQIVTPDDVDQAFAPDGAMAYLLEARAEGLARQIGVTGHSRPAAHLRALEHFDRGLRFDAMQLPINPIDFHQQSFQRAVLPALVERGIGVIAMKTSADGALLQRRVCTIDECQRFVWSLPVSVAVVGMQSPGQVRENAARARQAATMATDEMDSLLTRIAPRQDLGLEWYKRA